MLQIYDALFEAAFRLGGQYGPPVALTVLALVAGGVALHLISRFLPRGGPRER